MENRLGLRYTTHMINCHNHHQVFNAVFTSTVNLGFLRLQPKGGEIQKIQKGTKNEDKWKEARQRQTKQWLIMLNIITEGNSKYEIKMRINDKTKTKITTRLISPSPFCLLI